MTVTSTSTYLKASRFSRRQAGVVVLALAVHGLLAWAMLSGLGRQVLPFLPPTVQAVLIADAPRVVTPPPVVPRPTPPTPPRPEPAPATAPAPAPTPAPALPSPAAPSTITVAPQPPSAPTATPSAATLPRPAPASPAPVARPSQRVAAGVNLAQCDKPAYPSASMSLQEEGTVTLRFLVSAEGRVLQSEVQKSSGSRRLDEAARNGLSRCLFRPASVDGVPVQDWATLSYVWKLD